MKMRLCGLFLTLFMLGVAGAQTTPRQAADLVAKGQFVAARQAYLVLAGQSADASQTLAFKGEAAYCLFQQREYAALRAECEELLDKNAANPNKAGLLRLRSMLVQIPYKQRHWAEAADALGHFIGENPNYPRISTIVFSRVDALSELGRHGEARQELLNLIASHPKLPEMAKVRYQAALCLYKQGTDDDKLREEAEGLIGQYKAKGNKVEAQRLGLLLARVPKRQKKWDEAAQALGGFIEQNPDYPGLDEAVLTRTDVLEKLGRHGEARQGLLELIAKHPELARVAEARQRAALCLFYQGDYVGFEREAAALTELKDASAAAWNNVVKLDLAESFGKRGRWAEQAAALEQMIAGETRPEHREWPEILLGKARREMAAAIEHTSGTAVATELRAQARAGLAQVRGRLETRLAAAKEQAAIDKLHMLILESYYMEENYAGMAGAAEKAGAACRAPSLAWAKALTWQGVAKCKLNPPDYAGAAKALDAVLAAEVEDDHIADNVPSTAAYWRAMIAEQQKDAPALKAVLDKLQAMPEGPIKKATLARFGGMGK